MVDSSSAAASKSANKDVAVPAPQILEVSRPQPGELRIVDVERATDVSFDFGLEDGRFIALDVDVIIAFTDGAKLLLPNLGLLAAGMNPPNVRFAGRRMSWEQVLSSVTEVTISDATATIASVGRSSDAGKAQDDQAAQQASAAREAELQPAPLVRLQRSAIEASDPVAAAPAGGGASSALEYVPKFNALGTGSSLRTGTRDNDYTGYYNKSGLDVALGVTLLNSEYSAARTSETGGLSISGPLGGPGSASSDDYSYQAAGRTPPAATGLADSVDLDGPAVAPASPKVSTLVPAGWSARKVILTLNSQTGGFEPDSVSLSLKVTSDAAATTFGEYKIYTLKGASPADATGAYVLPIDPDAPGQVEFYLYYKLPNDAAALETDAFGLVNNFGLTMAVTTLSKDSKGNELTDTSDVYFGVKQVASADDLEVSLPDRTVYVLWANPPGAVMNLGGGDDTVISSAGADTLTGGDGVDLVSYARSHSGIRLNMNVGVASSGGYARGDLFKDEFENVIATAYNDSILGNSRNNHISGVGGADTVDGGDGSDTVDYVDSADGVTVDLSSAAPQTGGGAQDDVLINVENIIGSAAGANVLTGDKRDNKLVGGAADDVFYGSGGADTYIGNGGNNSVHYEAYGADLSVNLLTGSLRLESVQKFYGASDHANTFIGDNQAYLVQGGSRGDWLHGGALSDTFFGRDGSDTFFGSASADSIIGGDDAGRDLVDYSDFQTAQAGRLVINEFAASFIPDGSPTGSERDNLSGIEDFAGSLTVRNEITGGAAANVITGGNLADTLSGGGGADTLSGRDGNDSIVGGDAGDWVSYAYAAAGVSLDVAAETAVVGLSDRDQIIALRNALGSAHADTLLGDAGANSLAGGAGDDLLIAGAGDDYIDGGDGYETIAYSEAGRAVTASLHAGTSTVKAGSVYGVDTIVNVEQITSGAEGDYFADDGSGMIIDAAGGVDTIDFSGASSVEVTASDASGVTATIASGAVSAVGVLRNFERIIGSNGSDKLLFLDALDHSVVGSGGLDTIATGAGADTIAAGSGGDSLAGGGGEDILDYSGEGRAISVSLNLANAVTLAVTGAAQDVVSGFERVVASRAADTIFGDSGANTIVGGGGADSISGGQGNDSLYGGNSSEGAWIDYSYAGAGTGVTLRLGATQQTVTVRADDIDVVSGFANIVGTDGADSFLGDARVNRMMGRAGADTLDGGDGLDTADFSYAGSTSIVLTLDGGTFATAFIGAQRDLLRNVENVIGGGGDDFIRGDARSNSIFGAQGNDTIGAGTTGNDSLDGGEGVDRLNYGYATGGSRAFIADGSVTLFDSAGSVIGQDTFANFENISGTSGADTFASNANTGETLDGAGGVDVLDLSAYHDSATISLMTGTTVKIGSDFFTNVEGVLLGDGADSVTGDVAANRFETGGGADTIYTGGGADTVIAGDGDDYIGPGGALGLTTSANAGYGLPNVGPSWTVSMRFKTAASFISQINVNGYKDFGYNGTNFVGPGVNSGNQALDPTKYVRLTVTYDSGANSARLYLDGDLIGQNSPVPSLGSFQGFAPNVNSALVNIQDYSVFDKALDSNEIAGLNVAISNSTLPASAMVVWNFESLTDPYRDLVGGVQYPVTLNVSGQSLFGGEGADTIVGGVANDTLDGGTGADVMNGGAGNDSYSVDSLGDRVSDIAGAADVVLSSVDIDVANVSGIERFVFNSTEGRKFTGSDNVAESVRGGAGDDTLLARGGNDTLDGDGGVDTVDYSYVASGAGVSLSLNGTNLTTANVSTGDIDRLANIENVIGTIYSDTMVATDSVAHNFFGGQGDDSIGGGFAADTLDGGDGTDTAFYSHLTGASVSIASWNGQTAFINVLRNGFVLQETVANFEKLVGSANNDTFFSNGSAGETFDGGAGVDTFDSSSNNAGVSVSLMTGGTVTVGSDVLVNMEGMLLGNGADTVTGDVAANRIETGGGADKIYTGGGADTVIAGEGDDYIGPGGALGLTSVQGGAYKFMEMVGAPANPLVGPSWTVSIKFKGGSAGGFMLYQLAAPNYDNFGWFNGKFYGVGDFSVAAAYDPTQYFRLTETYDSGTRTATLYLNGQQIAQKTSVTLGSIASMAINQQGANVNFDDIEFFSSALDATQVGWLNDTISGVTSASQIAASWNPAYVWTFNDAYSPMADLVSGAIYPAVSTSSGQSLSGGEGADTIFGGVANDTIDGGTGADVMNGGAGNDSYSVDSLGDRISDFAGIADMVISSVDIDVANVSGIERFVFNSTEGRKFTGSDNVAESVLGGAGDDTLLARGGNDTLDGGAGVDTVDYSYVASGAGVSLSLNGTNLTTANVSTGDIDRLANIENVIGTIYSDTMIATDSVAHNLVGGQGDDSIGGGFAADTLDGGDGTDTAFYSHLTGASISIASWNGQTAFINVLRNGSVLQETVANFEKLVGSANNDTFFSNGLAGETFDGGGGSDLVTYADVTESLTVTLNGASAASVKIGNVSDYLVNVERLVSGGAGDSITGDAQANYLDGGKGADTLLGGDGSDTLDGGEQNDSLDGGAGNDLFVVDSNSDQVVDSGGVDQIRTSLSSLDLRAVAQGAIENLTYTGSGDFTGIGTAASNVIVGGGRDDSLIGGDGADKLDGGDGADTLDGGAGAADTYVLSTSTAQNWATSTAFSVSATSGLTFSFTITPTSGTNAIGLAIGNNVLFLGLNGDVYGVWQAGMPNNPFDSNARESIDGQSHTLAFDVAVTNASAINVTMYRDGAVYGNTVTYTGLALGNLAVTQISFARQSTGTTWDDMALWGERLSAAELQLVSAGSADLVGKTPAVAFSFENGVVNSSGDYVFVSGGSLSPTITLASANVLAPGDSLTGGAGNDSLFGGNADDTLVGGLNDDTVRGGRGNDSLDGGAGATDWVSYDEAPAGVTLALNGSTYITAFVGSAERDMISGFEAVIGSAWADKLTGDSLANTLIGGVGDDTIAGAAGADSLDGGDGADTLDYAYLTDASRSVSMTLGVDGHTSVALLDSARNVSEWDSVVNFERVVGSAGADTFAPTLGGAETFDGGAGIDVFDRSSNSGNVSVSLMTGGTVTVGSDVLVNMEGLLLGNGADTVAGDVAANRIETGGGADKIYTGGGADTVIAGEGDDYIGPGGALGLTSTQGANGALDVASSSSWTVSIKFKGLSSNNNMYFQFLAPTFYQSFGYFGGKFVGMGGVSAAGQYDGSEYVRVTQTYNASTNVTVLYVDGAAVAQATVSLGSISRLVTNQQNANVTVDDLSIFNAVLDATAVNTLNSTISGVTDISQIPTGWNPAYVWTFNDPYNPYADLKGAAYPAPYITAAGQSLSGGDGADTIFGGISADTISGGAGIDLIDGGSASLDVLSFDYISNDGISLALTNGARTTFAVNGLDQDVFTNIEGLIGTRFADTLIGDGAANALYGGGGTDSIFGGIGGDTLAGDAGDDTIDGGGNNDFLTYAAAVEGVSLTLNGAVMAAAVFGSGEQDRVANIEGLIGSGYNDTLGGDGSANTTFGGGGNDSIFGAAGDDDVDGGAGNDRILGGDGKDSLTGNAGNDTLDGGSDTSIDIVRYDYSSAAVSVDLSAALASVSAGDIDTLVDIEGVLGTALNDTIVGDGRANWFNAGSGNDSIIGAAGDDDIDGGAGNDRILGGAGRDSLTGGSGNDTLDGGSDTSIDIVRYDYLGSAVSVDLSVSTVRISSSETDTLIDIEGVISGSANDTLIGDGRANWFNGGGGNDSIIGAAGDDDLDGGAGNDNILGAGGKDSLTGGAGNDTLDGGSDTSVDIVRYDYVTGPVTVDLSASSVRISATDIDTLIEIEGVLGSSFGDSLGGDTRANWLSGGAGNDTLFGGAAGADSLYGGAGNDLIRFASSTLGAIDGGAGNDTLYFDASGKYSGAELSAAITGIETLDFRKAGVSATLSLGGADVAKILGANTGELWLYADAGDSFTAGTFTASSVVSATRTDHTFTDTSGTSVVLHYVQS